MGLEIVDWVELRKKPIPVGSSLGFLITKKELQLKRSCKYVIRIIPEVNHYEEI